MSAVFRWDELTNRVLMTKDASGKIGINLTADTDIEIDSSTVVLFAVSNEDGDAVLKKVSPLRKTSIGWASDAEITPEDVQDIAYGRYTWNAVLVTDPAFDDNGIPYADERSDQVVPIWTGDARPEFILEDTAIMAFVLDGDISVLVPRFIRDDHNGQAMVKALQAATDYFTARIHEALIELLSVDECSERRLNELAWEYDAQWYDDSDPASIKREVIRSVMQTFGRLGTVSAVEKVLADVFDAAYIQEWWQYGGSAGHFKVITSDMNQTDQKAKMTEKMIRVVQRVSGVLDEIGVQGSGGTATTIASAAAGPQMIRGATATAIA